MRQSHLYASQNNPFTTENSYHIVAKTKTFKHFWPGRERPNPFWSGGTALGDHVEQRQRWLFLLQPSSLLRKDFEFALSSLHHQIKNSTCFISSPAQEQLHSRRILLFSYLLISNQQKNRKVHHEKNHQVTQNPNAKY